MKAIQLALFGDLEIEYSILEKKYKSREVKNVYLKINFKIITIFNIFNSSFDNHFLII